MGVRWAAATGALAALGLLAAACAAGGGSGGAEDIVRAVPFRDGERLVYELVGDGGEVVGTGVFTATARDGAWELAQSYAEPATPPGARPITDESLVVADAATLRPLSAGRTIRRRDPAGDESYDAAYEAGAEGGGGPRLRVTQRSGGRERVRELGLRGPYYDSQSALWVWRAAALGEGFEARYASVNPRDASQVVARLVVVDRQTLDVPAGRFETWRMQVRNGRDTRVAWIRTEPPHEVVQWDNGSLFLRLAAIGAPAGAP